MDINNEIRQHLEVVTDHITALLTMAFLLRTLRDWFVTLEAIALQNPALYTIPPKHITNCMTKTSLFKSHQLTCLLFLEGTRQGADILPIERGLGNRRQCNSTNNRHKGTNHPRCRKLYERETKNNIQEN